MTFSSVPSCPGWRRPAPWLLVAIVCAAVLAGCGGPGYEAAPVSGRVTLDGQAMANVHVGFQPVSEGKDNPNPGPGSFGVTDAQGRYTLQLVGLDKAGAVVGTHRVRLAEQQPGAGSDSDVGAPVRTALPASARDGSIEFTVPKDGTDKADFPLKTR